MVRRAKKEDSLEVAQCLLLPMEEIIYAFLGVEDYAQAQAFMDTLVGQEQNQYSYQNVWVKVVEDKVVGAVSVYRGEDLLQLREPVAQYVETRTAQKFNPELETQRGEWYIDSLGVLPEHQGKGYATELLEVLKKEYGKETLGLIVDNPKAKQLYSKLGFKVMGEKVLVGKPMEHMQYTGV